MDKCAYACVRVHVIAGRSGVWRKEEGNGQDSWEEMKWGKAWDRVAKTGKFYWPNLSARCSAVAAQQ